MKKNFFFTFLRVTMRFHDVFFVSLSVRSDIMRKVVSPDTCIMYLIHKHQDYLSRRAHGGRVSVNLNVRIRREFREVNAIIRVLLRQLDSTKNSPTSLYFTYRFTISTLQFRYENRFAERKISSRDPYPIFTDRYLLIFLTRRNFAEIWRDIGNNSPRNYIVRNILATSWTQNLRDVSIATCILGIRSFTRSLDIYNNL